MNKIPTALIILDGYGLTSPGPSNAVSIADTPVMDRLTASHPHTTLSASGEDVGLPSGQIGNSEVGHTNIGAGRVVYQDLTMITRDIRSGAFFDNPALTAVMDGCISRSSSLHIFGLLSPGGVHSHTDHLWALMDMAARRNVERLFIHCFMDGRDTPPKSGIDSVRECVARCAESGTGCIATIIGRFYAMDRDNRWERVKIAYDALVLGEAETFSDDPVAAVAAAYDRGETDEFIKPIICDPEGRVRPGDGIVFMNFRPDRAREITRAFVDPDFSGFERKNGFFGVDYVCMTQYDETMPNVSVAYPPKSITQTLGEIISNAGMTQLRIAETEKYAHVTFFFNGGEEKTYAGEDRILVNSPKQFPTYDLIPEMSAVEVTDKVCQAIASGKYDLIILNFANCDMVGHTGVLDAAVKAVETVDTCVGRVVEAVNGMGGTALITADHGNAEVMLEPDGITPHTAHTTNLVPFIIVGANVQLRPGRLSDIAPTILDLIGLDKPDEMTGTSLIKQV